MLSTSIQPSESLDLNHQLAKKLQSHFSKLRAACSNDENLDELKQDAFLSLLQEQEQDLIVLKRKYQVALKDQKNYQERLEQEVTRDRASVDMQQSLVESLKQQWADKETQYKNQLKNQSTKIKELMAHVLIATEPSSTHPVSCSTDHQQDMNRLKSKYRTSEQQWMDLKEKHQELQELVQDLTQKVKDQSWDLGHIENENKQLKEFNRNLMEESESYQRLLEEKTVNGDIMSSTVLQRSLLRQPSQTFKLSHSVPLGEASESLPQEKEDDDDGLTLLDDLKALALFVTRFVSSSNKEETKKHYILPPAETV